MTDNATATATQGIMNATLAQIDPEIAAVLDRELGRQRDYLEMIASENFVPRSVLQSQGSVLTNKYAEGYPGKRYYGGCEEVDVAESIAIERAKSLFGAAYANVQPHSGATANAAVLHALIKPGDKIMGLSLAHGGHLTHGMKLNFSGRLYEVAAYGLDEQTPPHRDGAGARAGARRASRRDHRRLVGVPAPPRLRRVPRDRRRGGRQAVDGHGALCGTGRCWPAPEPRASLRRGLDHRAQDAGRPPLGPHRLARRWSSPRSSTLRSSQASRAGPSCT